MQHIEEATAGREPIVDDRFIRERERRKLTGISRATWWRAEKRGEVPKSRRLVGSCRGWLLSEIAAWMRERGSAS